MHAIDRDAKKVMTKIVELLVDGYLKLDNAAGAFMPLVVEKVMDLPGFETVYPLSFRNDYLGFYQEVMSYCDGQEPVCNERLQRKLADFAALWLRNIKEQQEL